MRKKTKQSSKRSKINKATPSRELSVTPTPTPGLHPTSVVGVGASAGGLEAFQQLLAALPGNTGMAFVLVQHLAPKHESILSELLAKSTHMPVIQVTQGIAVKADHVYVIPPNAGMSIGRGILHLSPLTPDRTHRMPIDLFFRSLAEDQHSRAVGIILSGTMSDGTLGLQAIKAMGGVTFAQDDQSAKYNAMPRNAIAAGNVDFVLPPDLIARELQRIAQHVHLFTVDEQSDVTESVVPDETLDKIFQVLRNVSRVDFRHYKPGTIKRRITRRMFLRKIDGLQAYLQYLRRHREEVEALFNDVLINVTSFFRDPDAFESLKKAFRVVLGKKKGHAPIRMWVPGCSTGEEPYSLAIALLEYLGDKEARTQIQIFATDISDSILDKARAGVYPESISLDMSSGRLRQFFQQVDGGFQISKKIRDMCIFAKQDVAKDPPFSRLDLISCRNVMIYMSQVLQKRIIPTFHYGLNPDGILFLGSSETVASYDNLFVPIDKKHRIYTKKHSLTPVPVDFVPRYETAADPLPRPDQSSPRLDLQKTVEQILLHRYLPASVVVDDHMQIVHFIGPTGHFLDPAPGEASLNLLKLVKSGLHQELRLAFQMVKRDGAVRREGIVVKHNSTLKTVNFEVVPVRNLPGDEHFYLVVFEELNGATKNSKTSEKAQKGGRAKVSERELNNSRLQEELEATREYLQSIIEEQRTTNEELRSANEEIQSSNEELQSINEELETAKEELQSTNEELTTVNQEMQNRNDELTALNNDLNNLLSSVNIPIIMLSNDLRIRRFTPMAEELMNLIPSDVGRPITDIKPNFKTPDLKRAILRVIESLEVQETRVQDKQGKWYSMRIRPYRTIDNKIDGATIVLLEVDRRGQQNQS